MNDMLCALCAYMESGYLMGFAVYYVFPFVCFPGTCVFSGSGLFGERSRFCPVGNLGFLRRVRFLVGIDHGEFSSKVCLVFAS